MTATTDRQNWADMRAQDFDATVPLTLFDAPARALESTGDDLLSLLAETDADQDADDYDDPAEVDGAAADYIRRRVTDGTRTGTVHRGHGDHVMIAWDGTVGCLEFHGLSEVRVIDGPTAGPDVAPDEPTDTVTVTVSPSVADIIAGRAADLQDRIAAKHLGGSVTVATADTSDVDPATGEFRARVTVTITAAPIGHGGWTLLGTADFPPDATMPVVTAAPGAPAPVNRENLRPGWCEGCRTNRDRNILFVVGHADGRQAQVGSTCVHDYLGHVIGGLLPWDEVHELTADADDLERAHRSRRGLDFSLREAVALSLCALGRWGWTSATTEDISHGARTATGRRVKMLIDAPAGSAAAGERGELQPFAEWADTLADAVISAMAAGEVGDGEFAENLAAIASVSFVRYSDLGRVAAGAWAWLQADAAARIGEAPARHLGADPKDKVTVSGVIARVWKFEGFRGRLQVGYEIACGGGVRVKWITSQAVLGQVPGAQVKLTGTVKAHESGRFGTATSLIRCKLVELSGVAPYWLV